jgi:AcrR family transcriptional regulator
VTFNYHVEMAVSGGTRTRLDREARRAQLVDLGVEMLSDRPLDQVSVDDISSAAGISRGLLFHYFASKREFLAAVVQAAADRLLAVTDPDRSLPLLERLRAGLEGYVGFIEANRAAYVSLVRGAQGADVHLADVFEATRAAIVRRILDQLEAANPSPALHIAVRGWLGLVEEATLAWLAEVEHQISRDQLVTLLQDSLVDLLTRAATIR